MPLPTNYVAGQQHTHTEINTANAQVNANQTAAAAAQSTANAKYTKPATGIPESDLSSGVQTKLNAASGGGGGTIIAVDRLLGSHMDPVKGYYPSSDLTTNALKTSFAESYTGTVTKAVNASPSRFRIDGSLVSVEGFWWNNVNGDPIDDGGSVEPSGATSYEIEFWCGGTDVSIGLRNESGSSGYGASDYLIVVDDMILPPASGTGNVATSQNGWNHFPVANATRYHVLKFATSRVRKIRVMLGLTAFVEVKYPAVGDVWPAPPRFRGWITGDSWMQGSFNGTEGTIVAGSIGGELALQTGWAWYNGGQGGTGYIADGDGVDQSPFWSTDRQNARAALPDIDVNVVVGGGNDVNQTPSAVTTACNTMWNGLKTAYPNTPLIVVGAQAPELFGTPGLEDLNDTIRTAALANDNVDMFIDMWEPDQWITGDDGHMEDRQGLGSVDMFITDEALIDLHPGHAGNRNVAERIARALRGARVSL